MDIKKISRLSMLLAISVVLSLIESLIPIFNGMVPGVKLGLANIVILFAIYTYSFKDALCLSVLRVVLVGILRTGLFSMTFFFSLSGAILSLIFMYLAKKFSKLSTVGVSVIGAIFHSIGQILIAILFLSNVSIIYYLPFILIGSIITGVVVGMCTDRLLKYFD